MFIQVMACLAWPTWQGICLADIHLWPGMVKVALAGIDSNAKGKRNVCGFAINRQNAPHPTHQGNKYNNKLQMAPSTTPHLKVGLKPTKNSVITTNTGKTTDIYMPFACAVDHM
jgi:hypothetical protein